MTEAISRERVKQTGAAAYLGGQRRFELKHQYRPRGHQPEAIEALCENVRAGRDRQVLLGVTGSGKTYTLVLEYLHLVLRHPEDYRHILAITFTNKAADEMKSRVIRALTELQQESNPGLAEALQQLLPEVILRDRAALTLKLILHDYSSFSVSTIDSFFQKW
mgnify:CR=1 FL=1